MKSIFSAKPFNTAELMRHVWTEFSFVRMIIIPLLIALVAFSFSGLFTSAMGIYVVTLCAALMSHMVLANLAASAAMRAESTDNTWDFQRMSPLTSGELSMGKLYGSTSFYHYCTAVAIILNVISAQFLDNVPHELWVYMTFVGPLSLILCGLLGQSISFLASIYTFSMKRKGASSGGALFGILVGGLTLNYFTVIALKDTAQNFVSKSSVSDFISWHGIQIETIQFMIISIAFFLLCVHTGIYRLMRIEMQYKNMPFVWIGFITAILVYLTGIPEALLSLTRHSVTDVQDVSGKITCAAMIMLPIIYIGGYSWAANTVGYTRFFTAVKNKDASGALTSVPPWFVNLALALLLIILAMAASTTQAAPAEIQKMIVLAIGILLLIIRDVTVFHAILMPGATKHAGFFLILYMLCVYFLGPKIYGLSEIAVFMPKPNGVYLALWPLILEIALAAALLYASFRKARMLAATTQDETKA